MEFFVFLLLAAGVWLSVRTGCTMQRLHRHRRSYEVVPTRLSGLIPEGQQVAHFCHGYCDCSCGQRALAALLDAVAGIPLSHRHVRIPVISADHGLGRACGDRPRSQPLGVLKVVDQALRLKFAVIRPRVLSLYLLVASASGDGGIPFIPSKCRSQTRCSACASLPSCSARIVRLHAAASFRSCGHALPDGVAAR